MLENLLGPAHAAAGVALDGLALQQRVIANNIANANTPGFAAQRMEFESALRAAQNAGDADAVRSQLGAVDASINAGDYIRRAAVPGVQLDLEMAQLNMTAIKYQALVQGLIQSNGLLSMAITGDGER